MKLKRLRIENFKRFRAPLELSGLADGLNLFVAPNESGKSTVAEAVRAAFFERHKSRSVGSLLPWSDSSTTPTVEIEFELGGKSARLTKAFLSKKRCELSIDGKSLDATAAEDHLGGLLGFGFAGKGANSPEHMGIPGLLWIKQGTSHEISKVVSFASDHLRNALGGSLGELTATSGDAVIKTVEAERNELLTPSTGAPRGPFLEAINRRSALETELEALRKDIEAYRTSVDRLEGLRLDHKRDDIARPWTVLREQLATAQMRLDEAKGLSEKKAAQDAVLKQATLHVGALRGQLQAMERDEEALGLRETNLGAAQECLRMAQSQLQAWEPRLAAAVEADVRARGRLHATRQTAAYVAQARTVAGLTTHVAAIEQSRGKAQVEQDKLTQLQTDAQALAMPAGELKRLRDCSEALRAAQARLDAASTALEFELLPSAKVWMAEAEVRGSKRLTVVARTAIDIEGVGRISVLPGGEDLESLASDRDRERDKHASILQLLGVTSLAAADERERLQAQRAAEAKASAEVLAAHAPKGLAALVAEVGAQTAKLTEARILLEAMVAPTDAEASVLTVSQAESEESAARAALAGASLELNEAKLAASEASAKVKAAEEELAAVKATLSDLRRAEMKAETSQALTDALAHQTTAQSRAAELTGQLQTVNLPVLQQDVERLDRSAKQVEAAHAQRASDITRLEADLEAKGALGLEEVAAEKQREFEQVDRRRAELDRRAKALDHLLKLLTEKRLALARRLRAPLQKHLNHYLQILFPGASIEVSEDLLPGLITREGSNGAESGEFEDLSVGAREQMGVVARLAYADLLKAAGKPTLLILDDALVHTDEKRLGQMKRVLYDAAARHQILIFSCHAQAWSDLGVAPRSLG
ncbi:MAG: AAA family ATPase [Burkholderiales bacterium]|nr:AAA family ATPase [Burkholderiales bacterium]